MENIMNGMEAWLGASIPLALAAAFAGGVLASLTPCVYPMIPIVSTYVGSKTVGGEKTRLRSFSLSCAYVVGMALVYAALGMTAALTGRLFGEISTSPLAHFLVANVIVLLGLNILDVVPLPRLPSFNSSQRERKGIFGALLIGAASGLVASPCTAPVMGVLLTWVGTRQNVFLGGSLLFAFSLGMGSLLILVGTFSGVLATLPKSGKWMVGVKKTLGLIMLALGEYFLVRAGQLWL
jgi:thiol:disulfide interchange protein DsbD